MGRSRWTLIVASSFAVLALVTTLLGGAAPSADAVPVMDGHVLRSGDGPKMLVDTAAAADPAPPTALSRTGWTATADDQETSKSNDVASNVLDGNIATIWHSRWSGTPAPLPHTLTVDMKISQTLTGLSVLPRQDGKPNGRIGQYSITVSADKTSWGTPVATGAWADDAGEKTVLFSATGRYVRVTATTEAGGRGPWSSVAELYALGQGSVPTTASTAVMSRLGWTATASDAETATKNDPASNVLDGNATTFWHSRYTPKTVKLPHTITVDMKSARTVRGLSYLPRQDTVKNGNIGQYAVHVSTDGKNWGPALATGTWADDQTQKTVVFSAVTARYVRLTASTEAGKRGPWSSASEVNVLDEAPGAAVGGSWATPINFPVVPVSAVVLPNNKLLTFSAYMSTGYDKTMANTWVSILDLATGAVSLPSNVTSTNHQMFCTGLALLADGRVLIDGGSTDRATTLYDPNDDSWTEGPLLNIPRAYQGDVTLSTGQVLTLGGSWYDRAGGKDGEIFTPGGATGAWTRLPGVTAKAILTADPAGVYRADNHAWLFAVSEGGAFHAGPSKQMHWITTSGNGTITSAGLRGSSADAMNGNAVMYDVGKILTVGGATAYQDAKSTHNLQATARAYVVDISGGPAQPVVTTRVPDMAYQRAFSNSVVLPDGKVLVLGGQQHPEPFTDTGAAQSPELWDPATGTFTVMAPQSMPRTYHSVGVLLPDGRVFSGGGGLCGSCGTNHLDGEVYTPPYLLDADGNPRTRPTLTSAPVVAAAGSSIAVTTDSATPSFALVRTSAVTHTVNSDQRRIPLVPTASNGTTYTLQVPADKGTAVPGTYLLFALDANGTPSVARFIRVT